MGIEANIMLFFQAVRVPVLAQICALVSSFANNGFIWVLFTVILICVKDFRKQGVFLLVSFIVSYILFSLILSNVIGRSRPFDEVAGLSCYIGTFHDGYGCPSFHVISSFLFASFVYLCINKKFGFISFIIALVIAFSRIYLGVEYLTDVIFSMAIGIGMGFVTHIVSNRLFANVQLGTGQAKRKSVNKGGKHIAKKNVSKYTQSKDSNFDNETSKTFNELNETQKNDAKKFGSKKPNSNKSKHANQRIKSPHKRNI